jgi:hypothetical protein
LHFGDPPLEPGGQGFTGERRANNGGQDLVQVGQPLNCVGKTLYL